MDINIKLENIILEDLYTGPGTADLVTCLDIQDFGTILINDPVKTNQSCHWIELCANLIKIYIDD